MEIVLFPARWSSSKKVKNPLFFNFLKIGNENLQLKNLNFLSKYRCMSNTLKQSNILSFPVFWIFFLCILFNGCHFKTPYVDPEKYDRTIRVACIGDSITWGDGIEDREIYCYPNVLNNLLGQRFEVKNFGVSGATLLKHGNFPYWNTEAFTQAQEYNPDVVIIMLGTNDSKLQNWKYSEEFRTDLISLIVKFRYLPSEPQVWLCTPCPVYGDGQWGITPKIVQNQIIPIIRQVADEYETPLIDIFSALNHQSELFPDLVHPNAKGAELIARTISGAMIGI